MNTALERRRTLRLVLRRPGIDDFEWLVALHSDPANYPHSPEPTRSTAQAREVVEMTDADWSRDGIGYWLVEEHGLPVGLAGLKCAEFHGRPCFNLYYRFAAAARGRGLAAEMGREALAAAAVLDAERPILVRTRPVNGPARRLAETLGLTRRPDLDADDGFVVYASAAR